MEVNAKDNVFKVYTADIGLLIEMLVLETRATSAGKSGRFKGANYESLMADTFTRNSRVYLLFEGLRTPCPIK
jgi:hypothetical protein